MGLNIPSVTFLGALCLWDVICRWAFRKQKYAALRNARINTFIGHKALSMLFNTYCVALRLEIILQSSIVTCKEGGNIVVYIQYIRLQHH